MVDINGGYKWWILFSNPFRFPKANWLTHDLRRIALLLFGG
jgi:hypothetical protein